MGSFVSALAEVALFTVVANAVPWDGAHPTGVEQSTAGLDGWTPKPTKAPFVDIELLKRQDPNDNYCGFDVGKWLADP
jgi:hypothetical protein